MYNVIENFLANPCDETFKPIRHNKYLLAKVFRKDEDLAKEFFSLDEWSMMDKEVTDLDIREQAIVKDCLKATTQKN